MATEMRTEGGPRASSVSMSGLACTKASALGDLAMCGSFAPAVGDRSVLIGEMMGPAAGCSCEYTDIRRMCPFCGLWAELWHTPPEGYLSNGIEICCDSF